ncbi:MAG: helix-turn-helix transcriptional regulator [Sphingomonadaceae bacterium]|nr:helix-turn-helix transcriptional regulator [Sphingomonadaceae bacterium]
MAAAAGQPVFTRASSGLSAYDRVDFSAKPRFETYADATAGLVIVRHFGLDAPGSAKTVSPGSGDEWDALLFNAGTTGRFEGRIAGRFFQRQLIGPRVMFAPCGADIEIEAPAATPTLNFYFARDRLAAMTEGRELPPMFATRSARLGQLMEIIEREMRSPGFASTLLIEGVSRVIGTILADPADALAPEPLRIHLSPSRLRRTLEFIESDLDQAITLADMARVAGLSPFHFARMFKLTTGETPYRYVRARRLDRARTLLAKTSLPLAEIALACGFANQSHFTVAFGRLIGLSPGQYRRKVAG